MNSFDLLCKDLKVSPEVAEGMLESVFGLHPVSALARKVHRREDVRFDIVCSDWVSNIPSGMGGIGLLSHELVGLGIPQNICPEYPRWKVHVWLHYPIISQTLRARWAGLTEPPVEDGFRIIAALFSELVKGS